MTVVDPTTTTEWQALHREASLVRQLIGSGVTALGRATYGSGFGDYYTAFFGLSIGIERLAKLILVADYAVDNSGTLPPPSLVEKYGHRIKKIVTEIAGIANKRGISVPHLSPDGDPICAAIVENLDAFADASRGRYANFGMIGNPSFDIKKEPVNKWWLEVVAQVLDKHYRGTKAEVGVKERAQILDAIVGGNTSVLFFDENAKTMSDVVTASERTGQNEYAQKYVRFYTLCIVRWMAHIFREVTTEGAYKSGISSLSGHYEFFTGYTVEDHYLKSRRVWPIY